MNLDFETYSAAGTHLDLETRRFKSAAGSNKRGIALTGAYTYAEHHSTEVLVACYSFGEGVHTWRPGEPLPYDLLACVNAGVLVEAWNSFFEWAVWNCVCTRLYGWPALPIEQTRDSMARAHAWSLPGGLGKASEVLNGVSEKGDKRIMLKLSQPRNGTLKDHSLRHRRDGSEIWTQLDDYCAQDVTTEINAAKQLPELSPYELEVWKLDQKINARGVLVDLPLVDACIKIMKESKARYGLRMTQLTGGAVTAVSQATALLKWVNDPRLKSLTEIDEYLVNKIPDNVREALEIRRDVGGAAPAKLIAMKHQAASDGRLRGILQYCGAQRTRRWAGRGIQPQNMYNSGLNIDEIETLIPSLMTGEFKKAGDNPAKNVSSCLRSMLIAAPGKELICSDYSAIEAVVMACLAGEQWIIDVFKDDGKLYERTGFKITGRYDPESRKLGKVASLASQFQGARGAWLKFGAGNFLTNEEIDEGVRAWRKAAPAIVNFWRTTESAAISATQKPGTRFGNFLKQGRALYYFLPGGGWLTYVDARIVTTRKLSSEGWNILDQFDKPDELRAALSKYPKLYESIAKGGFNVTKKLRDDITGLFYKNAPTLVYNGVGMAHKWGPIETYGGKLSENIIQATARDLLADALLRIEAAGYPVIMHTHDEIVAEVPIGFGSIEEFEKIMKDSPEWAATWPIGAAGGWRGARFRK